MPWLSKCLYHKVGRVCACEAQFLSSINFSVQQKYLWISANPFNNQNHLISLKIVVSCTRNGIWSKIIYNRLYDERLFTTLILQGCFTFSRVLLKQFCTVTMMKEVEKNHLDQVLQQSSNVRSFEVFVKRHRLIKWQGMGLWCVQSNQSWNKGISVTVELKPVSQWHLGYFAQIRTLQTILTVKYFPGQFIH